jgi:hypothetical protein
MSPYSAWISMAISGMSKPWFPDLDHLNLHMMNSLWIGNAGHTGWVWDCVFSVDGAFLVTGQLILPLCTSF